MTLELTIAGLCLLVKDTVENVFHVVLPATHGRGTASGSEGEHHSHSPATSAHPQHDVYLVFPEASGIARRKLDTQIAFTKALGASTAALPTVHTTMLDISTLCADTKELPRAALSPLSPLTAGSFRLSGGALTGRNHEKLVIHKAPPAEFAGQVVWSVEPTDQTLGLLRELGVPPEFFTSDMRDGRISIGFVYADATSMSKIHTLENLHASTGSNFDHFLLLYPLFDSRCTTVPTSDTASVTTKAATAMMNPSQCVIATATAATA